jgi:hypothetical protein
MTRLLVDAVRWDVIPKAWVTSDDKSATTKRAHNHAVADNDMVDVLLLLIMFLWWFLLELLQITVDSVEECPAKNVWVSFMSGLWTMGNENRNET